MSTKPSGLRILVPLLVRSAIYFMVGALLVLFAVSYPEYKQVELETTLLKEEEMFRLSLAGRIAISELREVTGDLRTLAGRAVIDDYLRTRSTTNRQRVERQFRNVAENYRRYDKISLLDPAGRERIRVDYRDGTAAPVAPEELQDKSGSYYVSAALTLQPGEVYISPLDLNIEAGAVERPIQPTIRVTTLLFDQAARPQAILIVNYQAASMLSRFRDVVDGGPGEAMVLNAGGYWLSASDPADEWGFALGRGASFGERYPAAWQRIAREETGMVEGPGGMFIFRTLRPQPSGVRIRTDEVWKTVIRLPDAPSHSALIAFRREPGLVTVFLLFTAALSALLAWLRTADAQRRRTLVESERRLAEAQALAHVGHWEWDIRRDTIAWSDEIYRIFGREPRAFVPTYAKFLDTVHADDRERVAEALAAALRGGAPYAIEHRIELPDGQVRTVFERGKVVRDEAAAPLRMLGTVQDITERKRTDEALRRTSERIRDLYNNAPCGYHSLDASGTFVEINDTELRWLGYRREDVVGKRRFTDLLTAEGLKTFAQSFPRFKERGSARDVEYDLVRKDGSTFPALLSATAVTGPDGQLLMSRSTVFDNTERKRAEEALQLYAREQAELARLGQEALEATDVTALMEEAVKQVAATLDVQYCKVLELMPDRKALLLRAGVGWMTGLVGRATVSAGRESQAGFTLMQSQPVIVEDLRTETRFSGPPLLQEHGVVSGVSVVVGPADRPYGVMSAHTARRRTFSQDDVHFLQAVANIIGATIERNRAKEELRASEERVRMLLDSVGEGVYGMDQDGKCTFINPEGLRLIGYPDASELLGRNLHALVHHSRPDGSPMPVENCRLQRAFREGRDFHVDDEVFWRRDGTAFAAEYRSRPMIRDGKSAGGVVTFTDISARRAMEQALHESEAKLRAQAQELAEAAVRKDQFIATLAHELRNPLAPIRNAFEIIKRVPDRGTALSAVGMGERQVAQLVRLVDDLLEISRITRGKISLQRERVTLQNIMETAVETSRPYVEAAGQTLTVELPSEPVLLDADLTRMAQAISNLLINATKFTDRNSEIRLTACREKDDVTIAVQDNGIGIEPAMLPLVFDLFMQAEPAGSRGRGLGIGLPLVRSLVELHGGRVEAASPGLGQGATFTIHLPVAPASVAPGAPSLAPAPTAAEPAVRRRILVVDDDSDVVRSTSLLLQSYGHEVLTAANGASAIATALEQHPDIVLLDIGLPDMDGYEVARRLRAEPALRGVRLIAITGRGQEKDRTRSSEAGFDCHLVKPVDPETLEAIVRETTPTPAEPAVSLL